MGVKGIRTNETATEIYTVLPTFKINLLKYIKMRKWINLNTIYQKAPK